MRVLKPSLVKNSIRKLLLHMRHFSHGRKFQNQIKKPFFWNLLKWSNHTEKSLQNSRREKWECFIQHHLQGSVRRESLSAGLQRISSLFSRMWSRPTMEQHMSISMIPSEWSMGLLHGISHSTKFFVRLSRISSQAIQFFINMLRILHLQGSVSRNSFSKQGFQYECTKISWSQVPKVNIFCLVLRFVG